MRAFFMYELTYRVNKSVLFEYPLREVFADGVNVRELRGTHFFGNESNASRHFKVEVAAIVDGAKPGDQTLPVGDWILTPHTRVRIGNGVVILNVVVVVQVEYLDSAAERFERLADVLSEKRHVTEVEAEAEALLAGDLVQRVYVPSGSYAVGADSTEEL